MARLYPIKNSVSSLPSIFLQTAQVGIVFLIMLLLTGGRPSGFVVGSTACSSIVFVAYSEARRQALGKN